MDIQNIVIGKPIVPLWLLLGDNEYDNSFQEYTLFEEERNLANIIVKYGFMKSKNEIKRNRPDLLITLNNIDCLDIKIGKKRLFIIVGVDNLEETLDLIE